MNPPRRRSTAQAEKLREGLFEMRPTLYGQVGKAQLDVLHALDFVTDFIWFWEDYRQELKEAQQRA